MKRFTFAILFLLAFVSINAQQRRPIDSKHPLWMVHIDVWNGADPQKIIDLVPDDVKPFVCMNLSLSCQYDTDKDVYLMPQSYWKTYNSWATVCQKNGMWFTCQPASGGKTHIHDDELETFEYFFKKYPNFLGWNYAEQFWGFDEEGNKCSSKQTDRIALFAKLVEMSHKYGGFLTVSFCGNIWSHGLSPLGMLKRNSDLMHACKQYPDAILWLTKYTQPWCFYNTESVTFGPYISGLAKNYGVRYDNCGWNGALGCVLGDNHGVPYPIAAGIGTVMEECCVNGGAVWDAPETIPTESFKSKSNTTVSGYTRRNWDSYPGFKNAWTDMYRKILDGTLYIPTREEVIGQTKIVVVNNETSGSDEDKYASWGDLYDNIYKVTDPFNKGDGHWMNNCMYLKSTGRFGTIAIVPELYDSLANTIPTKVKKTNHTTTWSSLAIKLAKFKLKYAEVSKGDLYVNRLKNQLVTYCPYSNINGKKGAWASIPLKYNTCDSLHLDYSILSSGVIHENASHIDLYLNNYRTDTTTNKLDKITVVGATAEPTFTTTKRAAATLVTTSEWNAETGIFVLNVKHNGGVDVRINCSGNGVDRETDTVSTAVLETPKQPEEYNGEIVIEAEDMDYKNIKSCCTNPYYTYPNVRGHSGNGFIDFGTSTSGGLKHVLNLKEGGDYKLAIHYTNTAKVGNMQISAGGVKKLYKFAKTATNEWADVVIDCTLSAGDNTLYINNPSGIALYVDKVTFTPASQDPEQFLITIRDAEHGKVEAPETAVAGDTVSLNVIPDDGYKLTGWTVVHGNVTINDDNTFKMLDDIVTLKPVFGVDTAISTPELSEFVDDAVESEIYDLNGRKLEKLQKGINIIRYKNAAPKKVFIK